MTQTELFERAVEDICAYAHKVLGEGRGRFVFVTWVDGEADNEDAIALAAHPEGRDQVVTALTTAATAASKLEGQP